MLTVGVGGLAELGRLRRLASTAQASRAALTLIPARGQVGEAGGLRSRW